MCLSRPIKTFNRKPRKAYKVVNIINGKLYGNFHQYYQYKPRAWNIAPTPNTPQIDNEGFHVFTALIGAKSNFCEYENEAIFEILVDDVKYKGMFWFEKSLIVGKFKFIKRIK